MAKIDPKSIFDSAESFYLGAKIILKSAEKQMMDPQSTTFQLPILPYITNMSFSLELYLKCLLEIENINKPRTHEIAILYNKLSNNIKSKVSDNVPQYRKFEDSLKEISNAFEEWRYSYEKEKLNIEIGKINKAITIFRDLIIKIHPEWV
jgi:hypothetical protein